MSNARIERPVEGHWNGIAVLRAQAREDYRDALHKLPKHRLVDLLLRDDEVIQELGMSMALVMDLVNMIERNEETGRNVGIWDDIARRFDDPEFRDALVRVRSALERADQRETP